MKVVESRKYSSKCEQDNRNSQNVSRREQENQLSTRESNREVNAANWTNYYLTRGNKKKLLQ